MTTHAALGDLAITPRTLSDYRDMFLLTDDELVGRSILDCPAGASPFGAQVRALGGHVVSVDPAYHRPADELVTRARTDLERIVAWQRAHPGNFDWDYLRSPEEIDRRWSEGIDVFARDFELDGVRYLDAALPSLPFADGDFDLVVSGFLLFVYPELLGFDAHLCALLELVRVGRGEARVYPVHDTVGVEYPMLAELRSALSRVGVHTDLVPTGTAYTPRPDSDRMLVCRRRRAARG